MTTRLNVDGYLLEFPQIRVDCFTSRLGTRANPLRLPSSTDPTILTRAREAQLYLLTHVHTDHLSGLTESFTGQIICSLDTKRMLLRLEEEKERKAVHDGDKPTAKRKFGALRKHTLDEGTKHERIVDRIVSATTYELIAGSAAIQLSQRIRAWLWRTGHNHPSRCQSLSRIHHVRVYLARLTIGFW